MNSLTKSLKQKNKLMQFFFMALLLVQLNHSTQTLVNELVCSICLDICDDADTTHRTSCSHVYHKVCIDRWIFHENSSCPTCRADLSNLRTAAWQGDVETIERLISEGAEVNDSEECGFTAIHLATIGEQISILNILLENGADVDRADNLGFTSLHFAAQKGNESAVGALLANKANIDAQTNENATALMYAVWNGFPRIVRMILDVNINMPVDQQGCTVIHLATLFGSESTLIDLLQMNANVNAQNEQCTTPLMIAIAEGNPNIATILLGYGASVDLADNEGFNALHFAVIFGAESVVKDLVAKQPETINAQTANGITSLMFAAEGRSNILRFLLEKGAEVNTVDNDGWTALHLAAKNGNQNIVKALLENNSNVNSPNSWRATPLIIAAAYENDNIVKLLLENGAEVSAADDAGWTALHFIAQNGDENAVKVLLDYSANINALSYTRSTPLMIAAFKARAKIVQILLKKGANAALTNMEGKTALDLTNDEECVSLLENR